MPPGWTVQADTHPDQSPDPTTSPTAPQPEAVAALVHGQAHPNPTATKGSTPTVSPEAVGVQAQLARGRPRPLPRLLAQALVAAESPVGLWVQVVDLAAGSVPGVRDVQVQVPVPEPVDRDLVPVRDAERVPLVGAELVAVPVRAWPVAEWAVAWA